MQNQSSMQLTTPWTMADPFEQLLEDLGDGKIKVLSLTPVFTGTYSRIYRGKIRENGKLVAVKVLNAINGIAVHTMQRKVKRERKTWAAVKHPNILPLYGFADDEELFQPFGALISPWRQAGDASKYLSFHGASITHGHRMRLWQDVVEGVNHLHSFKPILIHGDLKPLNILIDDNGRAQLCDFGLVRIFREERGSGMTTTSAHTGTVRYLAYELVVAGDNACPTTASDMYAVGCIGLEFVFSQVPYRCRKSNSGGNIFADIKAGFSPAKTPDNLSPEVESIWRTLEACWNIEASNRPSATTLLAWLEGHATGPFGQTGTLELVSDTTVVVGPTEQGTGADYENKQQAIDVAGLSVAQAKSLDIQQASATMEGSDNPELLSISEIGSPTSKSLISPSQSTAAFEGGFRGYFVAEKGPFRFGRGRLSIVLQRVADLNTGAFFFFE